MAIQRGRAKQLDKTAMSQLLVFLPPTLLGNDPAPQALTGQLTCPLAHGRLGIPGQKVHCLQPRHGVGRRGLASATSGIRMPRTHASCTESSSSPASAHGVPVATLLPVCGFPSRQAKRNTKFRLKGLVTLSIGCLLPLVSAAQC